MKMEVFNEGIWVDDWEVPNAGWGEDIVTVPGIRGNNLWKRAFLVQDSFWFPGFWWVLLSAVLIEQPINDDQHFCSILDDYDEDDDDEYDDDKDDDDEDDDDKDDDDKDDDEEDDV